MCSVVDLVNISGIAGIQWKVKEEGFYVAKACNLKAETQNNGRSNFRPIC